MKKQNAGKGICYLLTYALFALLALWALPALLGWVGGLAARNYRLAPLIAANVLYWAVLAFLLLFRTHQSARLGRKGRLSQRRPVPAFPVPDRIRPLAGPGLGGHDPSHGGAAL